MKKKINRPRLFVRYLFWLCVLVALDITMFSLTPHWLCVNNPIWQFLGGSFGIFFGVFLLLAAIIILFLLDLQICLIWVEDERFHCKHLLTGHHECFPPQDVCSVSITYDGRKIFFVVATDGTPHSELVVELENTEVNLKLVRTFWSGDIWDWEP